MKKELAVAALKNGTVIDHIPVDALFKCVDLLGITHIDKSVTIGCNLESNRLGKKGIIKVADTFFPNDILNRIAIIAPSAVINIIHDYEVDSKVPVSLPDEIVGIVECNNPKCITRNEPMTSRFSVISRSPVTLRCKYCEQESSGNQINLL
ncbi:MAG: aspartate carbamoyltransferase regulatory subunit [Prevotella sp.]|nr:aspartate carbamoyltransferase regulatory subunit [Bacteroides sp.]MCM1366148.1 aspartate carbamoyltransferase regulatory subunit [Prevotella sp.]MCM1436787.1 aspartate carbamoyltransferase regulatory subunit [Prevotella sp.]